MISVSNDTEIYPTVVGSVDLMVALEEKCEDLQVSKIHHLRNMNFCTKFHCNPSSSYFIPTDETQLEFLSESVQQCLKTQCCHSIQKM